MPELPEVEVVRRGLVPHLEGRTISHVEVLHPRPVRFHPGEAQGFAAELVGRTITAVHRRGKYLWWAFTDDDALLVHLGMSGQFRVDVPDAELLPHTRVLIDFDDGGGQVRFVDQRMFGGLQLSEQGAQLPQQITHIARDPFDEDFDAETVARRITTKHTTIKRALLDQRVVSGIGNIYADESLWRARIHHVHPTDSIARARVVQLLGHARTVMTEALAEGGTSFDSLYVNVNGASGYFGRRLSVYGRTDQPCDRCGATILREPFMNRSSFRCPRCQPRPRGVSRGR